MKKEKIKKTVDKPDDRRRSRIKRLLTLSCCLRCWFITVAVALIITPGILYAIDFTTKLPIKTCLNQTNNCSLVNSNVSCLVNGGTKCITKCNENLEFYVCDCPVNKIWDPTLLTCSFICVNKTTDCGVYLRGNRCIANPIDSNQTRSCKTNCVLNNGNYECQCSAGFVWLPEEHTCILECINATTNCDVYLHGNRCIADTLATNQAYDCKTNCSINNGNYECKCPAGYVWIPNEHICVLICINSTTDCNVYLHNNRCLADYFTTNQSFNCKTTCIENNGDFECQCRSDQVWLPLEHTCVLICINETADCNMYLHGNRCIADSDKTNQAFDCKTICKIGMGSFYCHCKVEHTWITSALSCECPESYIFYGNFSQDFTCFKLIDYDSYSYSDALSICSGKRTHLPILSNAIIDSILIGITVEKELQFAWIAAENINDVWSWRADCYNTVTPVVYSNWYDFVQSRSVSFANAHGWSTRGPEDTNQLICQYDPLSEY